MTIDSARDLAAAGYYVAPVNLTIDERGKKRPAFPGPWSEVSTLTPDYEVFERVTGLVIDTEKSGVVVVDVDEHPGSSGSAALAAIGIVPNSPMNVRTQSGGRHYFYRQPETPLPCSQGVPVAGVDIRGLGGCVFGPGTVVIEQHTGRIVGEYTAAAIVPVAELPVLPPEILAAVTAATRKADRSASTLAPYTGDLSDQQKRTIEQWLDDDLDEIASAVAGERHSVLLSLSAKVVDRALKLGYTAEEAIEQIRVAYETSGGSEWDEKRKVAEWAVDRVAEDPLGVPQDWADPDEIRFEQAVRERVTKLRIEQAAKKLVQQDNDPVDLGRELDFDEPPDGLFGKAWVDGVLPMGETVLLFGERNVGKSFVAIDLGLSVASGRPWHGRPVVQGNVLYLAGEGAIGLPSRRRSWVQWHRTTAPGAFSLRDSIVHLTNPASLAAWRKVIVGEQIDLVIVDTVRRAGRGLEMESPGDAQEMIALLDDLRSDRHGCTVLALGHPTKSDPLQPAGAGTVQDALPMIHRLSRDGDGDAVIVDMVTTKAKDGPTGHLASFAHRRVGDSLVFVDARGTGVVGSGDPFNDERRRREEGW